MSSILTGAVHVFLTVSASFEVLQVARVLVISTDVFLRYYLARLRCCSRVASEFGRLLQILCWSRGSGRIRIVFAVSAIGRRGAGTDAAAPPALARAGDGGRSAKERRHRVPCGPLARPVTAMDERRRGMEQVRRGDPVTGVGRGPRPTAEDGVRRRLRPAGGGESTVADPSRRFRTYCGAAVTATAATAATAARPQYLGSVGRPL